MSVAPAISVEGLWKVFGPHPERLVDSPDADLSRSELRAKTGCTVAVKDVSFDVDAGEGWSLKFKADLKKVGLGMKYELN